MKILFYTVFLALLISAQALACPCSAGKDKKADTTAAATSE